MAGSLNKAMIIGNLGADPEVRYTAGGTAVSNLSIATNEQWTDRQSGERQTRTEWHRVTFFGRTAEVAGEYLAKGSTVYVEGRIETDKWEDREGNTRYTTKVLGNTLTMLDGKGAGGSGGGNPTPAAAKPGAQPQGEAATPEPAPSYAGVSEKFGGSWDDDIPFSSMWFPG